MERLRRHWPTVAALASGILLALCFEPVAWDWLVWLWPGPLLAALWFSEPRPGKRKTKPRWWHGFRLGFTTGFVFFLINVHWITEISRVAGAWLAGFTALLGLAGYLAIYPGLFGAFAATVGCWTPAEETAATGKRALFAPSLAVIRIAFLNGAAWCGLEWLRGIVFTGFGWNGLGVALKEHLVLVQFADVIGIAGYNFILMFCAVILFCTFVRVSHELRQRRRIRPHLDLAAGSLLVAGLFLYGLPAVLRPAGESIDLRARILQLNIPLEEKWSPDLAVRQKVIFDYRDLTRTFVDKNPPDVVLWPETAVPGVFSSEWVQEYFNDHILKGDTFHLITGLEEVNLENTEVHNTITILKGDTESYQMHKKTHLVPFGEFIPFRHTFPLFVWIAGGIIERDFTRGTSFEPLSIEKGGDPIGIIPLICFEDTVPRHVRRFLRSGPQVFVNVTNDGWFYDSVQPRAHFDNALFRCIEFRRPMIRAANTGVSGFIDERGRVTGYLHDPESGSTYIRGSLPGTVSIDRNPPLTIYARIGDSFSIAMGLIALLVAASGILRSRSSRAAK